MSDHLPSIRRTALVVVVIEIILQFQLFGQAQIMTLGGPNNASLPIVLFIYQVGFQRWDIGYAAAASEILFCIILIAAMTQYLRRARPRAADAHGRSHPGPGAASVPPALAGCGIAGHGWRRCCGRCCCP